MQISAVSIPVQFFTGIKTLLKVGTAVNVDAGRRAAVL